MNKDKRLVVRIDEEFQKKLNFLKYIFQQKNDSQTIRFVVEKEYRKETYESEV